ncbi:MAG: hypothetical protein RLZZ422_800 [Pseudomonadota bacterium]|jgi:formylglycine-generating enzyme required for sulfatase activity
MSTAALAYPMTSMIPSTLADELRQLQAQTAQNYRLPPVFRDRFLDGSAASPLMVVIPAGLFEMGSSSEEYGHQPHEAPIHTINLAQPFAIGQFPVTGQEFEQFKQETGWFLRPELLWYTGKYPVVNIRLEDIRLYIEWLNFKTGLKYRLPTEPEWEYVARAGTQTPFFFGDSVSCKEVHFNPNFPYEESKTNKRWYLPKCLMSIKPSEVGIREPNTWNVYDMHGNVWEFTSTHWTHSHLNAHRDGSPSKTANPHWYVTKGGSWFDGAAQARSAARKKRYFDELDTNLGFRLVRDLEQ